MSKISVSMGKFKTNVQSAHYDPVSKKFSLKFKNLCTDRIGLIKKQQETSLQARS